jgi:hypothetical protein
LHKRNKIKYREYSIERIARFINYINKRRTPAAPARKVGGTPTRSAAPVGTLDDEVAVEVAKCDPTNGVFIFDALAVSVDTGPDVVELDPSLAVVPAAVRAASDAAEPVDAALSVTAAAADSVVVPDSGVLVIPVPVVSVAADAAVAAESVTPVIAAVSVAEAELLIFSASVRVPSSSSAFGTSEPPDSGTRPV